MSPASSDAASHDRSSSRRIFSPAAWQTASICCDHAGAMAVASTAARAVGPLVDGHEVQQPVLVQLVELPRRLEADHVRQVRVGRRGKLELPQLDAGPADGHQGLGPAEPRASEFGGDAAADALLGGRLRPFLVSNGEGMFDHGVTAAARGHRQADFTVVPFQGKKLRHGRTVCELGVRSQKSEARSQEPEVRSQKWIFAN